MSPSAPTTSPAGVVPALTVPLPPPGRYVGIEHDEHLLLVRLGDARTSIGRGPHSDIPADSSATATITVDAGRPFLTVTGALGDVRVNGRPTTGEMLRDGDELRVGATILRYVERRAA
jgi:hypothetical protein